jgi:starch-binding outer membrane protein SusE/F
LGETYSNVITLPSVKATIPDAKFTDNLFLIGSSIQTPWESWKPIPQVEGLDGNYYGIIYVPAGGEFKFATEINDELGYNQIKEIVDEAGAGISAGDNQKIKVANAGWYTLHFKGTISKDKKNINWTLTVYKTQVCLIGACIGQTNWGFADENALTPPDDPSGDWVSPAFTAGSELRVAVKVGDCEWWSTEFTILKGDVFWRKQKVIDGWKKDVGSDYSVSTTPGQKLYVNFDTNKAEVK